VEAKANWRRPTGYFKLVPNEPIAEAKKSEKPAPLRISRYLSINVLEFRNNYQRNVLKKAELAYDKLIDAATRVDNSDPHCSPEPAPNKRLLWGASSIESNKVTDNQKYKSANRALRII